MTDETELPYWMRKAMAESLLTDTPLQHGWRDRTITDVDDLLDTIDQLREQHYADDPAEETTP